MLFWIHQQFSLGIQFSHHRTIHGWISFQPCIDFNAFHIWSVITNHHHSIKKKCPNWYCYESISASYHSFDSLSHHHPILQTLPVDSEYNSQTSLLLPTCPPLNSTIFSSLPLSVQWSFLIMTADRSVTLFFILQSFWLQHEFQQAHSFDHYHGVHHLLSWQHELRLDCPHPSLPSKGIEFH